MTSSKQLIDKQWIRNNGLGTVFRKLYELSTQDTNAVDGEILAIAVNRLVRAERAIGGPYADSGESVDLTTNLEIFLFLRQFGVHLPQLERYIALEIHRSAKPNARLRRAIQQYRDAQLQTQPHQKTKQPPRLYTTILTAMDQDIAALNISLRPTARKAWKEIQAADKNREIGLLPAFFAGALQTNKPIPDATLRRLGMGNFYCWMAYTIYDDFIDDTGQPNLLPFANVAMRRSMQHYLQECGTKQKLIDLVTITYDGLDQANSWEMAQARAVVSDSALTITKLPRYGNHEVLATRAMAHVLGPLLLTITYTELSSPAYSQIYKGLQHYLIARQLNDDLHDWREDLRAGHLSPVVTFLLRRCAITAGTYEIATIEVKLQNYFWHHGLDLLCQRTRNHLQVCRQALQDSQVIRMDSELLQLITRLEAAISQSQTILAGQKSFLAAYRQANKG